MLTLHITVFMVIILVVNVIAILAVLAEADVTYVSSCNKVCEHDGTCYKEPFAEETIQLCNCTDGWIGDTCESEDFCFGNDCTETAGFTGDCTPNLNATVDPKYTCDCKEGFSGAECKPNNACLNVQCPCDGICTNDEDGKNYTCADPCGENGTCGSDGKCTCSQAYCGCDRDCIVSGPEDDGVYKYDCDGPDPCAETGTCYDQREKDDTDGWSCKCGNSVDGLICQHGGTCLPKGSDFQRGQTDGQTDYKCECTEGYSGESCENNTTAIVPTTNTSPQQLWHKQSFTDKFKADNDEQ